MEKIRPFLTTQVVGAIGAVLFSIVMGLKLIGILDLVVSFWAGFLTCLAAEAFAVYYFLLKLESKTEEKLDKARKLTREVNLLIEQAAERDDSNQTPLDAPTSKKPAPMLESVKSVGSSSSLKLPTNHSSTPSGILSGRDSPSISRTPSKASLPDASATKPTIEGVLTIQFVGKKKTRAQYNCFLRGGVLYYKKRVGMGGKQTLSSSSNSITPATPEKSTLSSVLGFGSSSKETNQPNGNSSKDTLNNQGGETTKQMVLTGAQIRRVEESEFKGMKYAIEILHPERKIIYKIDYLFIMTESEMDLERWYFALLTCCVPHNGYVDVELNKLLHDRFRYIWRSQETANWLSALWARFHLNMRVSQSLREKMINKVALRLGEKIEEKGLQNYIGNLQISDLDLGSKPPTIESAMIVPPDHSGDLITDVWLHYRNGDASLTLSCEVNLKRLATIPIAMTVSCRSLSGKLQLRVPPFPAERFSISFYEEPTVDLVVEMAVGEKSSQVKNFILPKIKDIIVGRLKLAIVERFVAPHRKYIRIPTTAKSDPLTDKPTQYSVKTSLKAVPSSSSNSSASISSLASSSASISSDDSNFSMPNSPSFNERNEGSLKETNSTSNSNSNSTPASISEPLLASNNVASAVFIEKLSADAQPSNASASTNFAAELEGLGLAPVPEQDRVIPGKDNYAQSPARQEERFSTKMRSMFRSVFKGDAAPSSPSTVASPAKTEKAKDNTGKN